MSDLAKFFEFSVFKKIKDSIRARVKLMKQKRNIDRNLEFTLRERDLDDKRFKKLESQLLHAVLKTEV